jgi:6-phosphogluconolactonase (cycloisomerase 2 family)
MRVLSNLSRREFLRDCAKFGLGSSIAIGATAALALPVSLLGGCATTVAFETDTWLVVGHLYDEQTQLPANMPRTDGLTILAFDTEKGRFGDVSSVSVSLKGKTLLADEKNQMLYAADYLIDNPDYADNGGGGDIYCYQMAYEGSAVQIDTGLSYGACPSALAMSAEGDFMLTAHAGGGGTATVVKTDANGTLSINFYYSETSLVSRQIEHDGSLGAVCDRFLLNPDGALSNPSDLKLAPSGKFFLLCDPDANKLYSFKLRSKGELVLSDSAFVQPDETRGFLCAFHPTGPWAYVLSSYSPQLLTLSYSESGLLAQLQNSQVIESLAMAENRPKDFGFQRSILLVSNDGRFVYCGASLSNGRRSEFEQITVFAVDAHSGLLEPIQYYFLENASGATAAAISPDGKWMVVACCLSCELLILKIKPNGQLELHDRMPYGTPVSLCWHQRL